MDSLSVCLLLLGGKPSGVELGRLLIVKMGALAWGNQKFGFRAIRIDIRVPCTEWFYCGNEHRTWRMASFQDEEIVLFDISDGV